MSGSSTLADRLATLLVELRGRLGPDFTNRRRVVSLVADRLPEAGREIKVLGTAIDDGVLDTLEAARGGRLDLEIDRIATAFEARHGVRSDIAKPVVQAMAHALGLAGLPSAASGTTPPSMPQMPAARQDDWVGASSVVATPAHAAPPAYAAATPAGPAAAAPRTAAQTITTWVWRGLGVFGAVIGTLLVIGLIVGDRDERRDQPPQPQPPRVAQNDPPRPQPQPQPQPQPLVTPQPQPQPQPQPRPQQQVQPAPVQQPPQAQQDIGDATPQGKPPPADEPSGTQPQARPQPQPQPQPRPQQQQATPQLPPGYDVAKLQALAARERQDFGVMPPAGLHQGGSHGPTPTTIPGGRVIDTLNLIALLAQNPAPPMALVDALGGADKLPNAYAGVVLAQGGSFDDNIQTQMRNQFQNLDRNLTIVTYCADPNCWMSYNAALRFINLGFRNVFWYRGGLWAWREAGLQTQPQQQQQQQ